uniref:Uncharacterized protein n=1 Tax=Nelumbo nucifera TaxID=4432 RepID=A0A822XLC5_NELNU|nr:TPA_asm: hypothetical protein HUJ06_021976 [Nelumbo nucifera]
MGFWVTFIPGCFLQIEMSDRLLSRRFVNEDVVSNVNVFQGGIEVWVVISVCSFYPYTKVDIGDQ